mmetsp:Transcript_1566/g.5055  ORF Transcript_1566/g.5055 Transcript_1566/m.5055 type:complete len:268 (+) Transcript_1566:3063-3866(+)
MGGAGRRGRVSPAEGELAPLEGEAEPVAASLCVSLLQAPELAERHLHRRIRRTRGMHLLPLMLGEVVSHGVKQLLEPPVPAAPQLARRRHVHPAQQRRLRGQNDETALVGDVEVPVRRRVDAAGRRTPAGRAAVGGGGQVGLPSLGSMDGHLGMRAREEASTRAALQKPRDQRSLLVVLEVELHHARGILLWQRLEQHSPLVLARLPSRGVHRPPDHHVVLLGRSVAAAAGCSRLGAWPHGATALEEGARLVFCPRGRLWGHVDVVG